MRVKRADNNQSSLVKQMSEKKRLASLRNLELANLANKMRVRNTKVCVVCHTPFYCKPCHAPKRICCSKKCQADLYKEKMKGSANPNFRNLPDIICRGCGKGFQSKNRRATFCSKECYINSEYAQNHRKAVAKLGGRGGRVDHNQKEIVDALRSAGVAVLVTSHIGKGFPDIIAGVRGENFLMEIKNPKTSYGKAKLKGVQKEFHETWCGSVHIVYTIEDAFKVVGLQ